MTELLVTPVRRENMTLGYAVKVISKREMEMQIQLPKEILYPCLVEQAEIRSMLVRASHGSLQRNGEVVCSWELSYSPNRYHSKSSHLPAELGWITGCAPHPTCRNMDQAVPSPRPALAAKLS